MKNSNIPEIRFRGFTYEWEQRKLQDIVEYYDGTHQTPKYTKSGVPFVSVENIGDIKATNKYISKEDFEAQFKVKPQKDDIFMTRITAGIIGDTALVIDDKPLAYYVSLALIRPKEIDSAYLEKYINSSQFKNELHKRIIHTAFPKKINLGEIGQCIVSFPQDRDEQEKIGRLFQQLDDTIALYQRELTILKQTKQGFLQKMFPKQGEKEPEVRFPGFYDDWEQRKLGELVDIIRSYSLSRDVETNEDTGFRYIHYGDIHKKVADLIKSDHELPRIKSGKYEFLEKGDVIVADASEDYIGIAEPSILLNKPIERVVAGLHTIAIRPKTINPLYLYYLFRTIEFKQFANKVGTGMKVYGITSKNLLKFETQMPSYKEQQKMGIFFKQLDDTIVLHQQELELLQRTKKAFLQKMFV